MLRCMSSMESYTMTARAPRQIVTDLHADSGTCVGLSHLFLPEDIVAYTFATNSLVTAPPAKICGNGNLETGHSYGAWCTTISKMEHSGVGAEGSLGM